MSIDYKLAACYTTSKPKHSKKREEKSGWHFLFPQVKVFSDGGLWNPINLPSGSLNFFKFLTHLNHWAMLENICSHIYVSLLLVQWFQAWYARVLLNSWVPCSMEVQFGGYQKSINICFPRPFCIMSFHFSKGLYWPKIYFTSSKTWS